MGKCFRAQLRGKCLIEQLLGKRLSKSLHTDVLWSTIHRLTLGWTGGGLWSGQCRKQSAFTAPLTSSAVRPWGVHTGALLFTNQDIMLLWSNAWKTAPNSRGRKVVTPKIFVFIPTSTSVFKKVPALAKAATLEHWTWFFPVVKLNTLLICTFL
jgi:hypothetical protein